MQCPIDKTDLVMTDRQGVEIDYCPKCRGVWLDRGELDKIIERCQTPPAPQTNHTQQRYSKPDGDSRSKPNQKSKSSLLGELFDF